MKQLLTSTYYLDKILQNKSNLLKSENNPHILKLTKIQIKTIFLDVISSFLVKAWKLFFLCVAYEPDFLKIKNFIVKIEG